MFKTALPVLILSLGTVPVQAKDFAFTFDWGKIPKCTNGHPNTVASPIFALRNVPAGTEWIVFKLVDLNVPAYRHGGGWARYSGKNRIAPGAFAYKSPCPPGGSHTYEWTAAAMASKGAAGKPLATAKSAKRYP